VRISRRHLLAASALVVGTGFVGTTGLAVSWWFEPPAEGLRFLSKDEVAFLDAFAEAVYPEGGEPALGGRRAQVWRVVDEVWVGLEPIQRHLLREAMHGLDHLARNWGGQLAHLPPERAAEVVESWLRSPRMELRGLVTSFHVFVGMAWMLHPEVAPTVARQFRCGFGP
jgi:hypothetical protein